MNYDLQIREAARKKGWGLKDLTEERIKSLALEVRGPVAKVQAGIEKTVAIVVDQVVSVSLTVLKFREGKCEPCESYLPEIPSCLGCGCAGSDFLLKRRSPQGRCPRGRW